MLCTSRRDATAAHRPLARVFALLHDHLDAGLLSSSVLWMPAHTSEAMVGVAKLSNGSALTQLDRELNDHADWLAKAAVGLHRVPLATRDKVLQHEELARELAMWVGLATFEANHFGTDKLRDSEATSVKHSSAYNKRKRPNRVYGPTRPPALGGHTLVHRATGLLCIVCRRRSQKNNFAREKCTGSTKLQWAIRTHTLAASSTSDGIGHKLARSGDVIWCTVCGLYTEKRTRGIAQECQGPPRTQIGGRANQRASLTQGLHPRTGVPLPAPVFEILDESAAILKHVYVHSRRRREQPRRSRRKRATTGSLPSAKRNKRCSDDMLYGGRVASSLATVPSCAPLLVPDRLLEPSSGSAVPSLAAVPGAMAPVATSRGPDACSLAVVPSVAPEVHASRDAISPMDQLPADSPTGNVTSRDCSSLDAVLVAKRQSHERENWSQVSSSLAAVTVADHLPHGHTQRDQVISTNLPACKRPKLEQAIAVTLAAVPPPEVSNESPPHCGPAPGSSASACSDKIPASGLPHEGQCEPPQRIDQPLDTLGPQLAVCATSSAGARTLTSAQQRLAALRLRVRERQRKENDSGATPPAAVDAFSYGAPATPLLSAPATASDTSSVSTTMTTAAAAPSASVTAAVVSSAAHAVPQIHTHSDGLIVTISATAPELAPAAPASLPQLP